MGLLRIGGPKVKRLAPLKGDGGEEKTKSGTSFKSVVVLLLALDVLALGGWLYARYGLLRNASTEVRMAESALRSLRERGETAAAIVNKLARENAQSISQPQDLLNKVFRDLGIIDHLGPMNTGIPRPYRPNENYEEVTVTVNLAFKSGYALSEIMRLLKAVEDTNPMVQIKSMDMGKRDLVSPDQTAYWRPTKIEARILRPVRR